MYIYEYRVDPDCICLEDIFECGQTFRWRPADLIRTDEGDKHDGSSSTFGKPECYEGACGSYFARIILDGDKLTVEATGGDSDYWFNYLDLGRDYAAIKNRLIECEPGIRPATESGYGIRILNQDFFEMLISFIISQNNNIPRIRKCIEAICSEYGEPIAGSSMNSFPSPEALAAADVCRLGELKLGYRCEYIVESARRFLEHGIPKGDNSEDLKKELLAYHGVGPKVADCIMLFGLSRVDAFPIDVWVKKIMNDMYGFELNDTKGMHAFASEHFGEIGGLAQQYLFHYYRNVKPLE